MIDLPQDVTQAVDALEDAVYSFERKRAVFGEVVEAKTRLCNIIKAYPHFYTAGLMQRIQVWVVSRFGEAVMSNRQERAVRLAEEAIELAQAEGVYLGLMERLLLRVYAREKGEPTQEAAGVGVTWLAYCRTAGISPLAVTSAEMSRVELLDPTYSRQKHQDKADAGVALAPTPTNVCKHGVEETTTMGCRKCWAERSG